MKYGSLVMVGALLGACGPTAEQTRIDEEISVDTEVVSQDVADDNPLFSALSRLTNDEYRTALGELLDLSESQRAQLRDEVLLVEEIELSGLVSSSELQQLNQLVFNQFAQAVGKAVELRLEPDADPITLATFNERIGCSEPSMSYTDCLREVGHALATEGFRGHVDAADLESVDTLLDVAREIDTLDLDYEVPAGTDPADALLLAQQVLRYRVLVEFVALSPKFVLLFETGEANENAPFEPRLTDREIATRMAFFLTGAPADEALLSAASTGLLGDPAERRRQATRLLQNEATVSGPVQMVSRWLGLDGVIATEGATADAQAFLRQWILEQRPFADLYTSEVEVVTVPEDGSEAEEVTVQPFGILGLHAVVASHTNHPVPSFINRGEFVVADLLCGELPDDIPAEAVVEEAAADPVTVFEEHTHEPCATCHVVMDNYGAAFQRFDAVPSGEAGVLRYDPTNDWLGGAFDLFPVGDVSGVVSDVGDLASLIAPSTQAHTCFAELWYRHAMRREMSAPNGADDAVLAEIVDEWRKGDSSVASLLEAIVAHEAFVTLHH